jgi:uncharacterized protein YaiI (UPF0178 family)
MKILIDADACPVVDITVNLASEYSKKCIIICDTAHYIMRENAETITAEKGADSVDFRLVNLVKKGDIAVTQDYGLAAMCLAKGAIPVNQNGLIFTNDNIEKLLYTRFVSKKIRMAGGRTKGPSKSTKEQDKDFEKTLRTLLEKEK